jgi:hypothetical protein
VERITETRIERKKRLRENRTDRFAVVVAKTWLIIMVMVLLSAISSKPISNFVKDKSTYGKNRGFESVVYYENNH